MVSSESVCVGRLESEKEQAQVRKTLASRWRAGEATTGLWLSLGTPVVAELAAECGPDVIVLDAQHGLWDRATLEWALGMGGHCAGLVRVARNRPELIGQALDAGAAGVIVPLVNTPEEAAQAVAAAHYPPKGQRSGGGIRPLRDMGAYISRCGQETVVCTMVETAEGLANAAAIAATPGVDMVFIGPGDLGLSLGDMGAGLEAAVTRIREVCAVAGMPCGIFTGGPAAARARVREGFRLVIVGDDISVLRRGFAAARRGYEGEGAHD